MAAYKNLDELNRAIAQLEAQKENYVQALEKNLEVLQEQARPSNLLKYIAGDIFGNKKSTDTSGLLSGGAGFIASFLIEQVLFRKASFLKRFIARALTGNALDALMKSDSPILKNIISKITDFIKKDKE